MVGILSITLNFLPISASIELVLAHTSCEARGGINNELVLLEMLLLREFERLFVAISEF